MTTAAIATQPAFPVARYALATARVLLGLMFFVSGLDGFLHFMPMPQGPVPEFGIALMKTGYMFPLITGTELVVGALLLSNRLVPLALVVLAPVMVNIIAFHVFLAPEGLAIPLVLCALQLVLAWSHRAAFAPLFSRKP